MPVRDRIVELRRVPAGDLRANPNNWRRHPAHQAKALAAVLEQVGYAGALIARETPEGLELIDGHLRAETTPDQEVPVLVLDVDEDEAALILATLDPLAAMAETDQDALWKLLEAVEIPDDDLARVLEGLTGQAGVPVGLTDPDDVPSPPAKPKTKLGDLWLLGEHRLLCGDARDGADVARLLDGDKVNVAVTSPPYAEQRIYDETSGFTPIPPDDYVDWFAPVAAHIADSLAPDGSWFLNIKPSADGLDTSLYVLDLVIAHVREWGWHFATEFCWERNGVPKGVTQRFKNQFEPVYQFARGRWKMRPDAVRHESANVPRAGGKGVGDTGWANAQGGNGPMFGAAKKRSHGGAGGWGGPDDNDAQDSNWQPGEYIGPGLAYPGNRLPTFTASHDATGHTASFPVGLPEFFIRAFSGEGDRVYDPFMGSGSTLIAAHDSARIGYGMDISPAYCDVTVKRWEDFTGKKAERVR